MSNTLREILGLVDGDRWGRRFALVSLLALEDHARPLTDHDLRTDLGRITKGEIRYDRRVLGWLIEEKVLSRSEPKGRQPALWWINPRVKAWEYRPGRFRTKANPRGRNVGIPWTSRHARRLALVLSAEIREPDGPSSELFPGQRGALGVHDLLETALLELLTRPNQVHKRDPQVHSNGESTLTEQQEHTFQVQSNGQTEETPVLSDLERDSLSLPREGESEEDQPSEAGDRLRSAINRHGHRVIYESKPGRRLRVLEMRYPDRIDDLVVLANTLARRLGSFNAIIEELEAAARQAPTQAVAPFAQGTGTLRPFILTEAGERASRETAEKYTQEAREALGRHTPSVE